MKYGKLVNGAIKYASTFLRTEEALIINPTKEQYEQAGYKAIAETEMPIKDGYYYVPYYEDDGSQIIQKWREEANELE